MSVLEAAEPSGHTLNEARDNDDELLPTSIFGSDRLVRRGWCPVTNEGRLYYELLGERSREDIQHKLVFIMGLNNSSFAWHHQVEHFGNLAGYSVLVFDNLGVGHSDAPLTRYRTSQLANHVVQLVKLRVPEWNDDDDDDDDTDHRRQLNIIGVSMGGMIACELAFSIPERIKTLLLTSTKSGSSPSIASSLPSYASLKMFTKLTTGWGIESSEDQVRLVVETLFPSEWLDEIIVTEPTRPPPPLSSSSSSSSSSSRVWVGKRKREMVFA
ncbi:hypothetical protein JCM3766R1_002687, partial [Sporobolomyces carnicolor]